MRNRTGQIYNDVEITNVAAEGKALAKIDNIVVFVKGVVPGDVVDIQITHRSRNFREAKPIAFKKYSEQRAQPSCK
ncbi:MAG: TRAM domain-containing protein, partial [Bacteroidales bacterium]|nr:TRAM domain-containing protein [Bacteroidales bacterium]